MDFYSSLLQTIPIDAAPVHRRDFMAEAETAASGQVQNDLLGAAEMKAVDDVEDAFHKGFLNCHCCQTCSHQRWRRSSDFPARWAESFSRSMGEFASGAMRPLRSQLPTGVPKPFLLR